MRNLFLLFGLMLFTACSPKTDPAKIGIASEVLTVTVLKPPLNQAINQTSEGGFIIGFRLVCINAATDTVIDKVITEGFNLGDSPNEFRKRIGAKMQVEIDAYQKTQFYLK